MKTPTRAHFCYACVKVQWAEYVSLNSWVWVLTSEVMV